MRFILCLAVVKMTAPAVAQLITWLAVVGVLAVGVATLAITVWSCYVGQHAPRDTLIRLYRGGNLVTSEITNQHLHRAGFCGVISIWFLLGGIGGVTSCL